MAGFLQEKRKTRYISHSVIHTFSFWFLQYIHVNITLFNTSHLESNLIKLVRKQSISKSNTWAKSLVVLPKPYNSWKEIQWFSCSWIEFVHKWPQESKWKIILKILKAPRMTVTGLFKFNHGMSAAGTKYRDMKSFCLDIPESLTHCLTCRRNDSSVACNTRHRYTG